ncbi:MAG: sensor domain-containing protein [Actinomycetota bacterium]|uniref:Sensor domain-containing protein n=1 Tax=Mycobacterium lentiflavum TaxID=141349 RepID=A0ABY3UUG8_MYCLN|nr:sensor domain-containing protein [Mycobacterium lentiflavum]MEE3062965.1 sensor domain-containing protein [Actinomycetota bacterium]ULP42061.1 sensor domain-containing protein [Mycobacterium lentiflavum]
MYPVLRWPIVLLAAGAVTAGCTRAVDGTPLAATPVTHIPAGNAAGPAPRALPAIVLDGLLLSQDQVDALMGGANMTLVGTATSTSDSSTIIDDRSCLGVGSVGDVTTYANSGYVAMRGNQFSTPNAVQADATQLVTSFTTAADAQALLQRAQQDWQRCAQRRYGFHSSNGNHSYFLTHDIRVRGSRLELAMHQEEDPRWGCSHAMAAQDSVVVEARVCLLDKDTDAAADNLLDQIIARIPP